ncbi:hypothetical protein PIB30_051792 [Stylosanthes scabra]|uniref:Uncharacterized protein n=1 Tax=Stylosanthes scabra TaxID=79078 RepID=A0ABU6SHY4_9FABA|nr:hypothetical protein [Stylosanthes scabra]
MEFGAATTTLPKKLSSGYGVPGRSAYDGVFTSPAKLRAPKLNKERRKIDEVWRRGEKKKTLVVDVARLGCEWQRLLRKEEATTQVGTGGDEEEEEEKEEEAVAAASSLMAVAGKKMVYS